MRGWVLLVLAVSLAGAPVAAAPLRIVAASEVRIEPRIRSDASALDVDVRVRDDRGAASHGQVRLQVTSRMPAGSIERMTQEVTTGGNGVATFAVPIGSADQVFELEATFEGDDDAAAATVRREFNLLSPFITVELTAPARVDIDQRSIDVHVNLEIGAIRVASPAGREVGLLVDGSILATARTDAGGHAVFRVRVSDLGSPGVRTLGARHSVAGDRVEAPTRRLVVRGPTTLTLERTGTTPAQTTLVGALATRLGGVAGAPVRIFSGTRILGGALTDERGTFSLALDPEVLAQPGLSVRASFAPTEPWYVGSESPALLITPPAPRKIPWTLVAAPIVVAFGLMALVRLRRRGADPVPAASVPQLLADDARLEQLAETAAGLVRLRVDVLDRSTSLSVAHAVADWVLPPNGVHPAGDVITAPAGGRFSVTVTAEGFAPRSVTGELPRGGEFALRIAIRTWREELFDRLRRWMRATGASGAPALPTPREVLAARGAPPAAAELVSFVEIGTYGAELPDVSVVERAEALARAAGASSAGDR